MMSSKPKILVKAEFMTEVNHILNYLEYAGEKLEAQQIYFDDGSTQEVSPEQPVDIAANYKNKNIKFIEITTKDRKVKRLVPEKYLQRITQGEEKLKEYVRVSKPGTDEEEIKAFSPQQFVEYISTRPGVQKDDEDFTGLFGIAGNVKLSEAREKVFELEGNTWWSNIISLWGDDAEAKGMDTREAWQNLLVSKAMDIAEIYRVPFDNFIMYGAFHLKDNHPHVHLFTTSTDKIESNAISNNVTKMKAASRQMRSLLFNEIFKDDVSYLKERKNELEHDLREEITQLTKNISHKNYTVDVELQAISKAIAGDLRNYSGRQAYGYLPPTTKKKINRFLQVAVDKEPHLKKMYDKYMKVQKGFIQNYVQDEKTIAIKLMEAERRFFNPGKKDNAVLHNTVLKHMYVLSDAQSQQSNEPDYRITMPKKGDAPKPASFKSTSALTELELALQVKEIEEPQRVSLPTKGEFPKSTFTLKSLMESSHNEEETQNNGSQATQSEVKKDEAKRYNAGCKNTLISLIWEMAKLATTTGIFMNQAQPTTKQKNRHFKRKRKRNISQEQNMSY